MSFSRITRSQIIEIKGLWKGVIFCVQNGVKTDECYIQKCDWSNSGILSQSKRWMWYTKDDYSMNVVCRRSVLITPTKGRCKTCPYGVLLKSRDYELLTCSWSRDFFFTITDYTDLGKVRNHPPDSYYPESWHQKIQYKEVCLIWNEYCQVR